MSGKPMVLVVLGTRPEAIKLAPVVRALRAGGGLECRVALTAQHRQMLDQTLASFELEASYDLDLMRPDQTLDGFCARALESLGELIRRRRPALVVVQGDTTTALCGALAAFHERVPVAHVEAGLRTFDRDNPFPEEANRVLIDELSVLLFPPTEEAAENLKSLRHGRALVSGNTVVDAVRWAAGRPRGIKNAELSSVLASLRAEEALILVTMHRRESFDGGLRRACQAMRTLLERRPPARIVFPVHLNPAVQRIVRRNLRHPRAHLLPTLDYFDLVAALRRCRFVMTDSGGIQEEAPSLGKPVLILRKATERAEAVRAGVAVLVGLEPRRIVAKAESLLSGADAYLRMARRVDVFGDGRAGERIAQAVRFHLGLSRRRPTPFEPS